MHKPLIICDKNLKSQNIKKKLLKIFKKNSVNKSNTVIVIGGDGFMLQTLKNKNKDKYFYGINSGNFGFLMNKFSGKNILKNLWLKL